MGKGDALRLAFGIIGNVVSVFLFLSPTVTFKRIITNKSTEQFSVLPYIMTLLTCLLGTWYGLPFITNNNFLVSAINIVGVVIETAYVLIFLIFSPKKEKARILSLLACVIVLFSAVALVSIFAFHKEKHRQLLCGFVVTIFSIIMYASPLAVMRMVIRTKSVEYMPFLLSLTVFLSAICFLVYGIIGKDIFILVTNALGSVLGAMQLVLYAIYCKNKGENKKPAMEGSMENGSFELQNTPNGSSLDTPYFPSN